ncbi:molybdate ABC transporter substrate-binding protein [Aliikangiella sp. G2MR2-5]|uniref:molybdate ABC transporter substrate-binding protein n=1 Tax=Aliikangiella sp. G2MR2-5 TaxID=2788943 RepID=UPI0018AA9C1F|nr:molybdate ABC transporter substrate-binding protein [Aliikangiella sp. G2MR2-5]
MKTLLLACWILIFTSTSLNAAEVRVAVASNFAVPIKQLAKKFELSSEHKVRLSIGSSGKFFAQIQHAAPYDLFLSADREKPQALINLGLAVNGSQFTYAQGRLVLWSRTTSLVDPQGNVLLRGNYRNLALANPKLAPYGAAAVEVLTRLKLFEKVNPKLIRGENIAQAFQYVATGNAEIGFISYSQLKQLDSKEMGSYWLVPESLHSPIRQDLVLLERAKENPAAAAFIEFLKSEGAQKQIRQFGYKLSSSS